VPELEKVSNNIIGVFYLFLMAAAGMTTEQPRHHRGLSPSPQFSRQAPPQKKARASSEKFVNG